MSDKDKVCICPWPCKVHPKYKLPPEPRTCKESIDILQGGRDERRCGCAELAKGKSGISMLSEGLHLRGCPAADQPPASVERRAREWCNRNGFPDGETLGDASAGYCAGAADTKRRALECVPENWINAVGHNGPIQPPRSYTAKELELLIPVAEELLRAIRAEIERRL